MSKESALAFLEKASTDGTLRSRVAAVGPGDAAGLVQLAASAGYPLSIEEVAGLLSEDDGSSSLGDGAYIAKAADRFPQEEEMKKDQKSKKQEDKKPEAGKPKGQPLSDKELNGVAGGFGTFKPAKRVAR